MERNALHLSHPAVDQGISMADSGPGAKIEGVTISPVQGASSLAPLLALVGVTKRFGGAIALDGVDFELMPGEIHGLVGENGAGKSTLMKILSGVHAPDDGAMELEGRPYAPDGPLAARQ